MRWAHFSRAHPKWSWSMRRADISGSAVNRRRYSSPDVIAHYALSEGLDPAEELLFGRYLGPGMSILDLGVGGGRTTRYLAPSANTYVGLDNSPAMIEVCRSKYPALAFVVGDASDLRAFEDQSFDAVVFSFNGIDYLEDGQERSRCLTEIARVLRDDGVLIFSSHNARALIIVPQVRDAGSLRAVWRVGRAAGKSVALACRHLRGGTFTAGEGYVWDPHHGGLWTYVSTPERVIPQLRAASLEVVEVISGSYPRTRRAYLTRWHYYACSRRSRRWA